MRLWPLAVWMGENLHRQAHLQARGRGELAGPLPPSLPQSCRTPGARTAN